MQAETLNAHAQLQTDVWMGEKHSTASVQPLPPSGAIELLASLPKSHILGEEQGSDTNKTDLAMKGSSGYSNPYQASCPANSERAPPSYEEIAGSSTQFGDAGKSLPTQFPPAYTEQEQNVRVVYLPAPNFGPKSAKVICSSCQVQCFFLANALF